MNITAFEYGDSIVVVDCGLSFPEDDMLGIDLVIPDVTYLKENISKVKGFVITHGHEDHIGALPYVLKEINVPIYATKLTLGLIRNKLKEHNLMRSTKLKEVKHGQVINLGDFAVEFIKTNHSIQDASALAIYSPVGIVIHTGDFKVDYTPVFGDAIDLQRFAEIGKKGVLALMCESTNAERPGFTMSERTVGHVFDNLFNEYRTSRIIIATFASNVDRVQQIINTAYRFGRKVAVEGRSMVNVISVASELGYLQIPENTLIEIDQVKNYPDDKVVLITTGSRVSPWRHFPVWQPISIRRSRSSLTIPSFSAPIRSPEMKRQFQGHQRTVYEGSQGYFPGCPCFRTCLPGGDQADLLPRKTEICHSDPW